MSNSAENIELCLIFEKACKQEMQILADKYKIEFIEPSVHIKNVFRFAIFHNDTVLIWIIDDFRDGFSFLLRKFDPKKESPMAYGKKQYSIQELLNHYVLKYQAPERFMAPYPSGSFEFYETSIRQYVDVLLKYGEKELLGDFSDLDTRSTVMPGQGGGTVMMSPEELELSQCFLWK